MPASRRTRPLPQRWLADLAATRGLGLMLDYDGTLAEIVSDRANAKPLPGIPGLIDQIAAHDHRVAVAIITGRRIDEIRKLLELRSPVFFSGVHGLEIGALDGGTQFSPAALACSSELDRVRQWLRDRTPPGRGFSIEDKQVAIGLHYRNADPQQARPLCAQFAEFVAHDAPSLKLLQLKMLLEAMPKAAGKDLAVRSFKDRLPRTFVSVYFGDDTTDEDAFGALDHDDFGVLVGAPRPSRARYRVASPHAVARELRSLASSFEDRASAGSN
ncbi:MAG TPA: trehalose-phosphatase [Patescibacteria group bacterium]|nr:trehalose-phosphatase [Patescibacteria group bacterium]